MQRLFVAGAFCFLVMLTASTAAAQGPLQRMLKHDVRTKGDVWAQVHASSQPWHGNHYYLPYGQPTALVVPPTAIMQQNYAWGVSQNHMTPTYHQYGPGAMPSGGGAFRYTPIWPSHTNQFGVYPVRSPW